MCKNTKQFQIPYNYSKNNIQNFYIFSKRTLASLKKIVIKTFEQIAKKCSY